MKYFAILAVASVGLSLNAQTADPHANATGEASASASSSVSAELTKKLDSKNASVGDQVMARTTATTTLSDGTKLPKGTQIVGHVTEVHAKSSSDAASHLAFGLDRAVTRDGHEIPIRGMLTSVAAPASASAQADDSDMIATPMGSAGATTSAGGRASGGGLIGGVGRATSGTLNSAGSLAGNTVSTAANGAATGIQATHSAIASMPGVTLSTSANAGESGALDAKGRNISLDSGTRMTFNLSAENRSK